MQEYKGQIDGHGQRIGIAVAQFNEVVTDRLLAGAVSALQQYGVRDEDITVVRVPGAFELPRAAQELGQSGKVAGVIALGAVVRGATSHYDYVCSETARGIADVSLHGPVPVMFGVLTTDTLDQAINRAGGKAGNKGADCAAGVLQMMHMSEWLSR
ncbi:6,7-dimethyl-8-ribityllumazine synthase [Lacticaseibacillus pabuli]|uniref:6,7-dimethyl-8-ribityllumazine synthase n=1 Tax=Lacticaseibacillus pabuli TaxID=3025672 RepID=A0ABY7WU22_9LACO|nr:6,7-dimethyl-8-ribityllumazine synthase [Lacticaseibacillus sp. KACC 23028]WDF83261.1 6,7-dimethyl-8-ribityllumazine synthase [Lacticaseibacillus sp. KACC 23028]